MYSIIKISGGIYLGIFLIHIPVSLSPTNPDHLLSAMDKVPFFPQPFPLTVQSLILRLG